ncbi:MAG: 2-oxo acid dehydrogenase subunit E2 [Ilumatobacteraceae bacterium]
MRRPPASTRRRIAVATWRPSRDGRIYARSVLDATAALTYVDEMRRRSGVDVTITHVVGAALGRVLRAVPEVRARVVFGRIVPFPTCDVGFAVDIGRGTDLAPHKVERADEKTTVEIARELSAGAARLRGGQDRHHRRSSSIVRLVPTFLLRPTMSISGFIVGGLGRPAFGQPGSPLGAAFVSNVGSLGLDEAYLAPLPFARTPLYVAIGAIRDGPAVVDGQLAVRPLLPLVVTGDHRLIDGVHAGRIATVLRELLADPHRLDCAAGDAGAS